MGNHQAGRAMVQTAVALVENSELDPMAILDIACEQWRGCDAEFDDNAYPGTPFGDLIVRAFPDAQPQYEDEDEGDSSYWEFSARYGFG